MKSYDKLKTLFRFPSASENRQTCSGCLTGACTCPTIPETKKFWLQFTWYAHQRILSLVTLYTVVSHFKKWKCTVYRKYINHSVICWENSADFKKTNKQTTFIDSQNSYFQFLKKIIFIVICWQKWIETILFVLTRPHYDFLSFTDCSNVFMFVIR